MDLIIRQERVADYQEVFLLIEKAFRNLEISDHREQFLVERLRHSPEFIPELSLVAELDKKLVGYILLSKVRIMNDQQDFESLSLAPVSVLPEYQNRGIGALLIKKAHEVASMMGFKSVVLVGHADYYPRFGYKPSGSYGIVQPFEAPDECCMVVELVDNGLDGVHGKVVYPDEFFE
jgi:predicted N-acetyltransferase YhbS